MWRGEIAMRKNIRQWIGNFIWVLAVISIIMVLVPESANAATSGDCLTVQAEKIVDKKVKPSDSEKKKLKKLFKYVENTYGYKRAMGFKTYDGWEKDYALEMYSGKKGSCYHFAAAYAFLAEEATDCEVRIGIGKTNGFSGKLQDHAWTEIKINSKWYICDTNMDKYAEKSSGKYFLKKRNGLKKVYNNFKGVQYFTL